ncbi:hypothetical protein FVE85_5588 [Porphyridium purpureum]|uniref:Fe2OG dioxygenase domain-containing protein n=1 Tax=Porphyridium purpureum TaxID=35688 RepID=A0A5J4Z555_PORPP|nr:hypothetical protein FVE85_5588 [Porphyridium purpureum]|eukprot:POR5220..scf295_1
MGGNKGDKSRSRRNDGQSRSQDQDKLRHNGAEYSGTRDGTALSAWHPLRHERGVACKCSRAVVSISRLDPPDARSGECEYANSPHAYKKHVPCALRHMSMDALLCDGFLSPEETTAWEVYFSEQSKSQSMERCEQAGNIMYAERRQFRMQLDDPQLSRAIFERMQAFNLLPASINGRQVFGCTSNIRLYEYRPGDRFGRHIDESNLDAASGARSEYTALIYLSGDLKGGEIKFYGSRGQLVEAIVPQRGRLLLHGHGPERCLEHEAAPVVQGLRQVLRTDVLYL